MDSPLAPVLANIFMGFHESKWLNEYNLKKPKLYLRYVDDILAVFYNEQDSFNFLNFLNNRHPNITFTIEKQNNHSIAFLDVFISGINNQNLTLQPYRKPIYTGNSLAINVTHYFIMKIPNKTKFQQIASNHSSGISFEDFMKLYKDYNKEPYSLIR